MANFLAAVLKVTRPQSSHSELQRLGDVIGGDPVAAGQIGHRPRDFPYAVIAARAQRQLCHRRPQYAQRFAVSRTESGQQRGRQFGVGEDAAGRVPVGLKQAGGDHACRTSADDSAAAVAVSASKGSAGTSTVRSSRSRNGPDSRSR